MEDKALDRARVSHLYQMDQLKYAIEIAKESKIDTTELNKKLSAMTYQLLLYDLIMGY